MKQKKRLKFFTDAFRMNDFLFIKPETYIIKIVTKTNLLMTKTATKLTTKSPTFRTDFLLSCRFKNNEKHTITDNMLFAAINPDGLACPIMNTTSSGGTKKVGYTGIFGNVPTCSIDSSDAVWR